MKKSLLARLQSGGFTMIELLIVIAILGVLATMVLAAINPIEQINRGRDTAARSDAEQLLGAIERYNAFNSYFPWMTDENDNDPEVTPMRVVNESWKEDDGLCSILGRLGTLMDSDDNTCIGTQEIKDAYVSKIDTLGGGNTGGATATLRGLYVYYAGTEGDNVYVCFSPQSNAFSNEASDRCTEGLPGDLLGATASVCVDDTTANAAGATGVDMICLP